MGHSRSFVKYIAAPPSSGKTSAILSAFLKSAEGDGGFTHYFYLAFDNNNHNFYRLSHDQEVSKKLAESQGASFVFSCVKCLFEESPSINTIHEFPCNEKPLSFKETWALLKDYLDKKLGPKYKILFHLDEHRKMCKRLENDDDDMAKGAMFSKGSMATLAQFPNVTAVATYVQRPPPPRRVRQASAETLYHCRL